MRRLVAGVGRNGGGAARAQESPSLWRSSDLEKMTKGCSAMRRGWWHDGVLACVLERWCGAAGARRGADELGPSMQPSIRCGEKSNEHMRWCAKTRKTKGNNSWWWKLMKLAQNGRTRRWPSRSSARKLDSLGAIWRRLLGANGRGGRGL